MSTLEIVASFVVLVAFIVAPAFKGAHRINTHK